jgi:hypothetical protein
MAADKTPQETEQEEAAHQVANKDVDIQVTIV